MRAFVMAHTEGCCHWLNAAREAKTRLNNKTGHVNDTDAFKFNCFYVMISVIKVKNLPDSYVKKLFLQSSVCDN